MISAKLFVFLALNIMFCFVIADNGDTEEESTDAPDVNPIQLDEEVYVLTEANFDTFIASRDFALVEFYAPWCGHCKQLAPEYAKAAGVLKDHKPQVYLGKVDATEHKNLASRFEVSGYPTLKFFIKGQEHEYDGPRDATGIVDYMKEKSDPNWKPPPEAVITLTSSNFREVVDNEDLMLVEFYAPWCGHCKSLAPKYEKAAKRLQSNDPPIKLAKVDATVSTDLASEFGVTGYPTLKLFRKGKASEYKGEREEHSIVSYMQGQVGDGSRHVNSLSDLQKSFDDDDVTVVAFFPDKETQTAELDTYMSVANDLREEYQFMHIFDPAACKKYSPNSPTVVVFKAERFYTKHEPKKHALKLDESTKSDDIQQFIEKHNIPLVGHYNEETKTKRYGKKRPLCLIFYTVDFSFDHRKATQLWRNKVTEIAKDYPDITFAILDDDENQELLKAFGLLDSGEEINIGILAQEDHKYPMDPMEEFDSDDIREFLDNFIAGKAVRHLKSQTVPKTQKGPVSVVVGNNFEKIVQDTTKDVLIMLYAPWCGHCKNLMPIWDKLAKSLQDNKNVVIAKCDATANDIPPEFKVEGFPSIYFSSAKDNKVVKYEGSRDVAGFTKYLKEHATASSDKSQSKDEL